MSTSIGPSGELIVATTTADPIATHGVRHLDPTLGGPGRLPGPAPYPLEIHTHGASRPVVRVEQVAEQARLDSEQEAIRLRMNDAAEAISRVRDTLAGTEQRQSQALTAAEVVSFRT